jgi:DNA-binding MarR family transcriptional regulator
VDHAPDYAACHRVQLLSLTRQGRRVLPQLAEIADRNDDRFFDCLDVNEQDTLRHLLRKLIEFHHIRDVPVD